MNEFVRKHEDRIHGVLSCFDRMLFRGCLPIMSGWSMAQLLKAHDIDCNSVKPFLLSNAERVKAHAVALARKHGRPFEYLGPRLRKEDAARRLAERDGIRAGRWNSASRVGMRRLVHRFSQQRQPSFQSAAPVPDRIQRGCW